MEWISNASANLFGSLVGVFVAFWLAGQYDKHRNAEVKRQRLKGLVTALRLECELNAAQVKMLAGGGFTSDTRIETAIIGSTAQEQLELIDDADLVEQIIQVRFRLTTLSWAVQEVALRYGDVGFRDIAPYKVMVTLVGQVHPMLVQLVKDLEDQDAALMVERLTK